MMIFVAVVPEPAIYLNSQKMTLIGISLRSVSAIHQDSQRLTVYFSMLAVNPRASKTNELTKDDVPLHTPLSLCLSLSGSCTSAKTPIPTEIAFRKTGRDVAATFLICTQCGQAGRKGGR